MTSTDFLLQQLINGLTQGMVYALIALGYTMVYGIVELINFAHGEIFMVGSFAGLLAAAALAAAAPATPGWLILPLALLAAMAVCGAIGVSLERIAYRPLRRSPRLAPLITAIGASYFIQNAVMVTLG